MTAKPKTSASAWVDPDDAPELTPEALARADVYEGNKLIRRGRPPTGNAKMPVSLRIDQDVVERLREMGPGWQTKANDALRAFVGLQQAGRRTRRVRLRPSKDDRFDIPGSVPPGAKRSRTARSAKSTPKKPSTNASVTRPGKFAP